MDPRDTLQYHYEYTQAGKKYLLGLNFYGEEARVYTYRVLRRSCPQVGEPFKVEALRDSVSFVNVAGTDYILFSYLHDGEEPGTLDWTLKAVSFNADRYDFVNFVGKPLPAEGERFRIEGISGSTMRVNTDALTDYLDSLLLSDKRLVVLPEDVYKTDKVVECIASTFNEKLSDYGLRMVVKIKLHAGKFKDIIRDRIVNHQDCVKKVVWEFPNIDRVKGIDAQSAMVKRLNYLHNFAVATNALKGQLVLFGQKGNDMKVYDDSIDDMAAIIALSAQNNYDLTYHFYNSPAVHIKKSSRAVFTIENRIIEDFNDGDMRFDDDGNETLDLICRLDQIRELINDYHNETTIVD